MAAGHCSLLKLQPWSLLFRYIGNTCKNLLYVNVYEYQDAFKRVIGAILLISYINYDLLMVQNSHRGPSKFLILPNLGLISSKICATLLHIQNF